MLETDQQNCSGVDCFVINQTQVVWSHWSAPYDPCVWPWLSLVTRQAGVADRTLSHACCSVSMVIRDVFGFIVVCCYIYPYYVSVYVVNLWWISEHFCNFWFWWERLTITGVSVCFSASFPNAFNTQAAQQIQQAQANSPAGKQTEGKDSHLYTQVSSTCRNNSVRLDWWSVRLILNSKHSFRCDLKSGVNSQGSHTKLTIHACIVWYIIYFL